MDNNKPNKRLTTDKNYKRPDKTYQDTLTNQEIKDKLKEYKKCQDIKTVSIGTHLRYFTIDPNTKEKMFRLGGTLNKIDPEGRFVVLGNGNLSWSVQITGTIFWQKLSEVEIKEELKEELKKELKKEFINADGFVTDQILEKENKDLKKEIKNLQKKLESFEDCEKENKSLHKKIDMLNAQLSKIAGEIKKEKKGK